MVNYYVLFYQNPTILLVAPLVLQAQVHQVDTTFCVVAAHFH